MPIYEYECLSCHQVVEAVQKFSDAPLNKCAHCQGQLKKLISHTSFQLKGTGWYVTDYARGDHGGAKGEKAAKPAENQTDKAECKTECKTECKAGCKTEGAAAPECKKADTAE